MGPRHDDTFALRYLSPEGDSDAPCFSPEDGPVYTDGSALFASLGGLAVAAFAAVQLRGDAVGCAWIGITGRVPGYLNQTAAAAERLALATATLFAQPGQALHLRTDCLSAAHELANLVTSACYPTRWSDLWRQVDGRTVAVVAHVKGHQDEPPWGSRLECHVEAYGNRLADQLAGARAASGAPAPLAIRLVQQDTEQLRTLAIAVARRLACWPPLRPSAGRPLARRAHWHCAASSAARGEMPKATLHPIQPHQKGWWCPDGMRYAGKRTASVFALPCERSPSAWAAFLDPLRRARHSLWAARVASVGATPVAFCIACGAYSASGRACGVARTCAGAPISEGARGRLRFLRTRRHPLNGLPLTAPVRIVMPGGQVEVHEVAGGDPASSLADDWDGAVGDGGQSVAAPGARAVFAPGAAGPHARDGSASDATPYA